MSVGVRLRDEEEIDDCEALSTVCFLPFGGIQNGMQSVRSEGS